MALGTIIRPTEGFRTEIVKTKTSENQVAGDLLVWNLTNKNYEKAATNASNPRCAIVVNTQTNVGNDANNTNIDGIREVLERDWEIVVKCTSGCNVGDELKYSATVAGTVDKWVPGTDEDVNTIVGRCVKLESQEHYDVTATLTNPGAASNIIMYKYPRRPTAVDTTS